MTLKYINHKIEPTFRNECLWFKQLDTPRPWMVARVRRLSVVVWRHWSVHHAARDHNRHILESGRLSCPAIQSKGCPGSHLRLPEVLNFLNGFICNATGILYSFTVTRRYLEFSDTYFALWYMNSIGLPVANLCYFYNTVIDLLIAFEKLSFFVKRLESLNKRVFSRPQLLSIFWSSSVAFSLTCRTFSSTFLKAASSPEFKWDLPVLQLWNKRVYTVNSRVSTPLYTICCWGRDSPSALDSHEYLLDIRA